MTKVTMIVIFKDNQQIFQDFTNFLDLASIGDIDKVTIRWKDVTMQNEGYYSYPDSIYVFELGKITSNNFGHEESTIY